MTVPRLDDGAFWLFAYGSLIWRPDLPFTAQTPALLRDWSRRFYQGSHDHRGTRDAPGRVVTLVRTPGQHCLGMAFRVAAQAADEILERLDHREKNGYERHAVRLQPVSAEGAPARTAPVDALVYLAAAGNFAWLGEAPMDEMANQIHLASGPSGANRDYLLELASALGELGAADDHVDELARRVERLGS